MEGIEATYEKLKISVPSSHGVVDVTVLRKSGRPAEYQVYNGYLASSTVHRHHLEKIILVAFDASIITITRDATVLTPNKYTVHPASLEVDQSEVWMDA